MGGVDERAAAILQLLFHAPGDLPAWRAFFEAFQDAISPGGRVVTLVETVHPAPRRSCSRSDRQIVARACCRAAPTEASHRSAARGRDVRAAAYMGSGSSTTRCCRSCSSPTACAPARLSASCWDAKARASGPCSLVLPRSEDWTPSTDDRALVAGLAPFLPQAALLHERSGRRERSDFAARPLENGRDPPRRTGPGQLREPQRSGAARGRGGALERRRRHRATRRTYRGAVPHACGTTRTTSASTVIRRTGARSR